MQQKEPEILNVRNVEPKGRSNKSRGVDKDKFEKDRLKQRHFGFHRYGDEIDNILETQNTAPAFQSELERFTSDACKEERQHKEKETQRKTQILEQRREKRIKEEQDRWNMEKAIFDKSQQRMEDLRKSGIKAKRNYPSMPYDIVNLTYAPTIEGMTLEHKDNMVKYRGKCRAANLDSRQNSRFNPITGANRKMMDAGRAPEMHPDLRTHLRQ